MFQNIEERLFSTKSYEQLVTALFLDPTISSINCMDTENLVGEVDLRLYAVCLLFLAATTTRLQSDGLLALVVRRRLRTEYI